MIKDALTTHSTMDTRPDFNHPIDMAAKEALENVDRLDSPDLPAGVLSKRVNANIVDRVFSFFYLKPSLIQKANAIDIKLPVSEFLYKLRLLIDEVFN
jgi:hypothetical protein